MEQQNEVEVKYEAQDNTDLYAALAAAQGEFPPIKKASEADAGKYKYSYADLAVVLGTIRPAMAKNGLAIMQFTREGQLITRLAHKSGQWIEGGIKINCGAGAQVFGSFMTYMRRYSLMAMVGVFPEDEDDDGAKATPEKEPAKRKPSGKKELTPAQKDAAAKKKLAAALKKDEDEYKKYIAAMKALKDSEYAMTGDYANYYAVLAASGYDHANDIKGREDRVNMYKKMKINIDALVAEEAEEPEE